jgi:ABC-2 type transport system permease protein
MWLRTRMVMWKEFKQIIRDPRLLFVVFMMPIMMLLLYGFAINLDVRHLRMAVYDQDGSQASRELIETFRRNEYFDVIAYPRSYQEITRLLDSSRARVVLVIPVTYSRDLARGDTAPVQVLVDGSDSTTASTAIGYLGQAIQQQSASISIEALERNGLRVGSAVLPVENRMRFWYNPELRSTNFLIPGLIAVILMSLATLLTSVTVVRERERGTIEQLVVSPIKPFELMLGKLTPYIIVAFADILLVLLMGVFVFHIPVRGNPLLVVVLASFFVTAALSIGLLVSTVAPTQQVAMMGSMVLTQLPTVLLSGFIFPISSMPLLIQWLTNIIPARHFIRILRGVVLKGNTVAQVWQPGLALLLLGVALLCISAARFKKKL